MKKFIVILIAPLIILTSLMITGCTKEKSNLTEDAFIFKYKDVDVTPGKEFSSKLITEEAKYLELESCAFEGNDKVYTYSDIEVTVSPMKEKDTIYSVYFLNDKIETTEGVKITDEKAVMTSKYGDNYEQINNKYTYTKGNVKLSFIIDNDIIISIEYTYNIDKK